MNSNRPKSTRFVKMAIAMLSLAAYSAVFAEESMEEVVVVAKSIKASQIAAIEAKRLADNLADVISADSIGRFPDQNLADALGRLAGLSIERDQGQARYLNFRGAPKRYTTTAFDGVDVPGVENGRVPRFDAYPAVITSQIIANKAITADMPGESVSGYIDVRTFKPSDIDGWSFSVELGAGEQDLGEGDVERRNGRVSYSNDRFGFSLYASENLREQVTDNRELEYSGTEGALVPVRIEFRNYFVDREDEAYGGALEFYLPNGGRVYASSLSTVFTDDEERNQWNFYADDAKVTRQRGTIDVPVRVRRLLEHGQYVNETDVNTLGAEFNLGEFDIDASYSKIDTLFDTHLPVPFLREGRVTNFAYDLTDPAMPLVTFEENLHDIRYPDPDEAGSSISLLFDAVGGIETKTDQFKIDVSHLNSWGRIKFGLKVDNRDARGGGAPLAVVFSSVLNNAVDIYPFDGASPSLWDTNFNNTIGGYYTDNPGILDALRASGYTRSEFPEDTQFNIEENILAAYVMQTIDKDWGNIVVGIRVEDTDYETAGSGLEDMGDGIMPLTVKQSYTNVLPNAHVNWDVSEDKRLRLSFSTGISRPTYIESRASVAFNSIAEDIRIGNPHLEEETSRGVDAAFEWYFDEASILAVSVFHRSIDNVISGSSQEVGPDYSDRVDEDEIWDLYQFGNGKNGKLSGIEMSFTGRLDNYLEGFFSGFGLETNITVVDSEYTAHGGGKFNLPGQSDLTYNLSAFYENYGLSARLSYGYRDAWLDETETVSTSEGDEGVYWDEQNRLDLSIRYDFEELIGHKLSVFLNMNNITDETDVRYTGNDWNPNQVEAYGRRFLVGVRFSL